jgi:hypothetical protein
MMYECRCPNDRKMLAHTARPPLPALRYVHLCAFGGRAEGKVNVEAITKRIIGQVECSCGWTAAKTQGYLVTVRCRKCKPVIQLKLARAMFRKNQDEKEKETSWQGRFIGRTHGM